MKKTLAVILTITFPIWCIPVMLGSLAYLAVTTLYKEMLEFLEWIGVKE
jgi:hypothetical protein